MYPANRSALIASCLGFFHVLSATGCATVPQVYKHKNLGFRIVMAKSSAVMKACRGNDVDHYTDDEVFMGNADETLGCWVPATREIWIDWHAPDTTSVLIHELCHADGQPKSYCAKVR